MGARFLNCQRKKLERERREREREKEQSKPRINPVGPDEN